MCAGYEIAKWAILVWLIILGFTIAGTLTPFITGPVDLYPFKFCSAGSCHSDISDFIDCSQLLDMYRAIQAFAILSIVGAAVALLVLALNISGKVSGCMTIVVLFLSVAFITVEWALQVSVFRKKFCGASESLSSGGGNDLDVSFGLFISAWGLGLIVFILLVLR